MSEIKCDIYIIGVGGQGIGLLSEAILRAADAAGHQVRGVDTHGLAQRGGTVVSYVRVGNNTHSPLVQPGKADLVVALERHEALRGMNSHLRDGGKLVFYDCEIQPLPVRLKKSPGVKTEQIMKDSAKRAIKVLRVFDEKIPDPKMQNISVLGAISKNNLLSEVTREHFEKALSDLLDGDLLTKNLEYFRQCATK